MLSVPGRQKLSATFVTVLLGGISQWSIAADVTFSPSVESKLVEIKNQGDPDVATGDSTNLSMIPSMSLAIESKKLTSQNTASYEYVRRSPSSSATSTDRFLEFNSRNQLSLIQNFMSLNLSASQSYQATNISNRLFSDVYNAPDSLTKRQSYNASLGLNLPNAPLANVSVTLGAGKSNSDNSINGSPTNGRSLFATTSISPGGRYQNLKWNFNQNLRRTFRYDDSRYSTYTTDLTGDWLWTRGLGFTFALNDDEYRRTYSDADEQREDTESWLRSAGLGLVLRAQDNYLRVLYNASRELEQGQEDERSEHYLSANFGVSLSPRTSLDGSYGRRFYGNTKSFSLSHNRKFFRSQINYSEQLTSNENNLDDSLSSGVFVCPLDYIDISDCGFTQDLDYEVTAEQTFVSFDDMNDQIDDTIRVRKTLLATLGYNFNRFSVSTQFSRAENDVLDSNQDYETDRINLQLSYRLGARSTFTNSVTYYKTKRYGDSDDESVTSPVVTSRSRTWQMISSLRYNYGNTLSFIGSAQYLNYEAPASYDGTTTEKRITLSLIYSPSAKNRSNTAPTTSTAGAVNSSDALN